MSKSAYCNKRAALFHVYRCHNRVGYDHAFNREIGNLMRGFMRQVAARGTARQAVARRRRNVIAGFDNEDDDDEEGDGTTKVGKEPMSVQFYKEVCRWFLDYGTKDGLFA
jgi:hypothetical protein